MGMSGKEKSISFYKMKPMTPKVFISHASEDKNRFVLDFAKRLFDNGIAAWVDEWEMYPGDSLIGKIFEEGIKNANAMIIVLSKNSIASNWVREELNAGMIKKINGHCKLIPVILDDCEVPECLQSTVWVKIRDIANYDIELKRITDSIYGDYQKPSLGSPPKYSQAVIDLIPGLSKIDSLLLKLSCEEAIKSNSLSIETSDALSIMAPFEISSEMISESIEILDCKGYIQAKKRLGGRGLDSIPYFTITTYGFLQNAEINIKNFSDMLIEIISAIVNGEKKSSKTISDATDVPLVIVEQILYYFEQQGLIKISEAYCGRALISIMYISPELKRILRDI